MRLRFQPWQLALLVVALCVAAVGVVRWVRVSQPYDAARLLGDLPADKKATLIYIDTGLLRRSGMLDLLAGSKAAEEPDYRKFVELTGFDYRTDLDAVAAALVDNRVYVTLRGRFQWKQLTDYAESQGGECHYSVCSMPGSAPERNISFYPLKSDVLALAVSTDPRAVTNIQPGGPKILPAPLDPVWVSVPTAAFDRLDALPEGMRELLSPLARAEKVTFSAGLQGDRLQVRLEVACLSPDAAADLLKQLSAVTGTLKGMLARQNVIPNPRDLSGVLVAGTFQQRQATVIATWPVERAFVESLAAGQIQ